MNKTGEQPQNFSDVQKKQEDYPNLNAGNTINVGAPTKYDPKYCDELIVFFSGPKNKQIIKSEKITKKANGTEEVFREYVWVPEDLPTLDKFARKIGVDRKTLQRWAEAVYPDDFEIEEKRGKLRRPRFSRAYNTGKVLQSEFLTDNGLRGLYPPASFIFVAKNVTEMRDKVEAAVDHTTKGEQIKAVAGFNYLPPAKQAEDGSDSTDNQTIA